MVGQASGYIQSLPAPVKKRIKALKKIQLEATKIEATFYEELHLLECKYHQKFGPLYAKRATITKGEYEPNEDEEEAALAEEVKESTSLMRMNASGLPIVRMRRRQLLQKRLRRKLNWMKTRKLRTKTSRGFQASG